MIRVPELHTTSSVEPRTQPSSVSTSPVQGDISEVQTATHSVEDLVGHLERFDQTQVYQTIENLFKTGSTRKQVAQSLQKQFPNHPMAQELTKHLLADRGSWVNPRATVKWALGLNQVNQRIQEGKQMADHVMALHSLPKTIVDSPETAKAFIRQRLEAGLSRKELAAELASVQHPFTQLLSRKVLEVRSEKDAGVAQKIGGLLKYVTVTKTAGKRLEDTKPVLDSLDQISNDARKQIGDFEYAWLTPGQREVKIREKVYGGPEGVAKEDLRVARQTEFQSLIDQITSQTDDDEKEALKDEAVRRFTELVKEEHAAVKAEDTQTMAQRIREQDLFKQVFSESYLRSLKQQIEREIIREERSRKQA